MIGELAFNYGLRRVSAVLTDDLSWHSDDRAIEDYLNTVFPPADARHDRTVATYYLYQVGERLGAVVRPDREAGELVGAGR